MRVEVLYVTECPTHTAAVRLVQEVLAAESATADVREIIVSNEKMACALGFLGSPTIRIDGKDVMEEARKPGSCGLSCRLYPGSAQVGLPPVEMVRRAVIEALDRDRAKQDRGISASLGAIVSSVLTISCCVPVGFAAALGAGAASALLATLRPWLLAISVGLLGLGFWQQRRAKQCAARGRWVGSVLLWTAVVVVLGMILFPQEIAAFLANRL